MSLGRSWALINSSVLFQRLAICMAVVGIVQEVRLFVGLLVVCASAQVLWMRARTGMSSAVCCAGYALPLQPQGIQDMLVQYLQLVVGFNTADQVRRCHRA